MKKIFSIIAIALTVSLSAFAQENGNRDENGKVVRGAYVTNNSTWFVSAGAGVNSFIGYGQAGRHGVATEFNVGKWFTPTVGARLGWSGLTDKVFGSILAEDGTSTDVTTSFWYNTAHADLLWSLTDQFGGYKESRIWDVALYPTFVFIDAKEKGVKSHNLELGAGVGLLNTWRLCERVDLNLDTRMVATRNTLFGSSDTEHRFGYVPSVSAGITIRFGKKGNTGFKRVSTVMAPLVADNAALTAANKALKDENDALKGRKPEVKTVVETVTNTVNVPVLTGSLFVTFEIGSANLRAVEYAKIRQYVGTLDKNTALNVVGSADTTTGTEARNQYLAEKRASIVANTLKDFGFTDVTTSTTLNACDGSDEASRAAVVTVR